MKEKKYSLNQIMTIIEASEFYNINYDTLRNKFKKSITGQEKIDSWVNSGLVRQSGKTWLLTDDFIQIHFGEKSNEGETKI